MALIDPIAETLVLTWPGRTVAARAPAGSSPVHVTTPSATRTDPATGTMRRNRSGRT